MNPDKVKPCAACGRATRPAKVPLSEYPGTMGRTRDKCLACYHNRGPRTVNPQSVADAAAGLERFLRARREREAAMNRREKVMA